MDILFNFEDKLVTRSILVPWTDANMDVLKAGTPLDDNGAVANGSGAVGIVLNDVPRDWGRRVKQDGKFYAQAEIVTAGYLDIVAAEASFGQAYTDDLKAALADIQFVDGGNLGGGGSMEVDANTYTVGTLTWDGSTTGRDTATMSMAGGVFTFTGYKVSDDTDISLISGSAKSVVSMDDVYPSGAMLKGDNFESFVYGDIVNGEYRMVSALVARGTSISGEAFGYSFTITCQSTGVYFINTVAAGSPMECKYTKAVAGKAAAGSVIEKPVYDGMAYFHRVASDVVTAALSGMMATVGAKYKIEWKDDEYETIAEAYEFDGTQYVRLTVEYPSSREATFDFPVGGGGGTFVDDEGYTEGYTPLKIWELETAKIPSDWVEDNGGSGSGGAEVLYVTVGEKVSNNSNASYSIYLDGDELNENETAAFLTANADKVLRVGTSASWQGVAALEINNINGAYITYQFGNLTAGWFWRQT